MNRQNPKNFITGTSTIGTNAIVLTIFKVGILAINMLMTMLLSRFRTLQEYGTYSQILLVINLFISLIMLGLPNSINYFLGRSDTLKEKQDFLSVYYSISTFLGFLIGIILLLSIPLIEKYFKNTNIHDFYYFLAIYPWTSIISSSIENVLIAYKKIFILITYKIINSICLLGLVLIVWRMKWSFSFYMKLYLFLSIVFAISVYITVFEISGGLKYIFNKKLIREIFSFSIPIGIASVIGTLNIEIDKLLIGRLMTTEQLAIYTNASKELPITIISSSITAILLPQLVYLIKNNKNERAVQLWGYATELAYIIICFLVAGVFTFAKDVLTLFYSSKYLPGLSVFRVYTLVLLLRCTYFGMILNACGKTKMIFYSSIISLILNAFLNPCFYYLFGMTGPAIATFFSLFIIIVLQLKLTADSMKIIFSQILPWRDLAIISLLNFFLAGFFKVIKDLTHIDMYLGNIQESIVLGIIWAIIYWLLIRKRFSKLLKYLNEN